jgi:formyl-CoA transferase
MAEVEPRLSETPGRIRHPGRALGAANDEVYKELGLSDPDLEQLRDEGVI